MNIEQEKEIVASLSSLYPMQEFEEEAIDVVLSALPRWIPCSERLPDMDGLYLVWADKSFIPDHADENNVYRGRYLATFNKTYCERWSNNLENIYAWMPLPAPPKEIYE